MGGIEIDDFSIVFGIFGTFFGNFENFGKILGLFLDSSWFSASDAPIFTPKGALGPDFGPEQNFGKS